MEVCRTCLNRRGSELVGDDFQSIFSRLEEENVYIADCLAQWVGRTIDENDGLPTNICQPCLEAIKSIALFIENAKECDEKLRNWLNSDNSSVELLAYIDLDTEIKKEPEDISTDVIPKREAVDEQLTKQEDVDSDEDYDQEEEEEYDENVKQQDEDDDENSEQEEDDDDEDDDENFEQEDDDDDDEDYELEQTAKRRKRTANNVTRGRPKGKKPIDKLDKKEKEMYNVIEVEDKCICCGCYRLFDNEADLKQHGKTVHETTKKGNRSKKVVCNYCYKRFSRVSQRQAHRKRCVSIERVFECKQCDKRYVNPESRYNHAHNHPKWNIAAPKMYKVPMSRLEKHGYLCCIRNCTMSHSSEDALLEHVKKDHNLNRDYVAPSESGDIQCPFCLRFYKTKAKLVSHYITRYNAVSYQREFQCHECGKIYSSQALLKGHENKHANVRPYECKVCNKRYYTEAVLKSHMLNHTRPKALECSICGMAFRRKMFLMNHYRVHSDDKPFECEVCHKTFRHSSTLFTHKKIHFPNLQYKCSECGKGFTDTGNLKRHLVSHTGIKPYQCNHCDKRFMRLTERSEHESIVHEGVMPYACEACGKQFSAKRPFQKHQQVCEF